MAHELEFRNGRASMFSVTETPWHREGVLLTAAPTLDEALALAGHDFTVEVQPTYRQITTGTGLDGLPVLDHVPSMARVTVRTDTGVELGAVGASYTALQNREAFAILEPLLDAGVAVLETGGTLRGGADVWQLVRFNVDKFGPALRSVFGNEVIPYGLVANNHSGRRGCLLSLTPVRVVCANTLAGAEQNGGRAIVVAHTQTVAIRVVEAAEALFAGVVERYELIAADYAALKSLRLTEEQFRTTVLDLVAPDPRDKATFNPDARMAEATVARAETRRAALTDLWRTGAGHVGDESAWEAYNAVVEAIDHNPGGLFPLRTGVYRTQALMQGEYGRTKQRTLEALVALTR